MRHTILDTQLLSRVTDPYLSKNQMISKVLTTVILTGFVAGLLVTAAQMLQVTPLILEAEKYELGQIAVPHTHASSGIMHDHVLNGIPLATHLKMEEVHETLAPTHDHSGVAHDHSFDSWAPESGSERTFYMAVSNIVIGIAFSLLLVAVYLLRGKHVDINSGLLWGAAGFVVFSVAPSLGQPPELPGMTAAALESRQVWWFGTVIATVIGIGLFTETKTIMPKIAAVALFAVPHIIGAPHPHLLESLIPVELSVQFVVASLVTSAFFWMVLGAASGYFYQKLVPDTFPNQ